MPLPFVAETRIFAGNLRSVRRFQRMVNSRTGRVLSVAGVLAGLLVFVLTTGQSVQAVSSLATSAVNSVLSRPQSAIQSADLSVINSDHPDPATQGSPLTYTVTIVNNGPDTAQTVLLTDTMPASASFNFATINQGSCGIAFPTLVCQLGSINPGGSVVLIIRVTPNVPGTITNNVIATTATSDPNTTNNSTSQDTTVNALSAICHWTGPHDNVPRDWSSIAYWDCGAIPGLGDTAVINGYGRVINVDSPVTVKRLAIIEGSAIHGFHTLTVTGNMEWDGEISGGAHLSPTGALDTVVIAPGAVLSITNTGQDSLLLQGRLVSYGTVEHAGGKTLRLLYAVIDNRPGGVYRASSGSIDKNNHYPTPDDGGSFNNAGALVKDGAGLFTLHAAFSNAGQVNVLSDTLKLEMAADVQVVTHTGSFSITAPGILLLSGHEHRFDPPSSISGQGAFRLDGADAIVRGTYGLTGLTDLWFVANLYLDTPAGAVNLPRVHMGNATRLRGSDDITITEALTMSQSDAVVEGSTGVSNTLNIASGAKMQVNNWGGISLRTLNNYGTIELASGQCFAVKNNAVLNNQPTGVFTVTTGGIWACEPFPPSRDGVMNNYGRFVKLGPGDFTIDYHIRLNNTGTIEVWEGALRADGPFRQTAGEIFLNGSTFRNDNYDLAFDGGRLRGSGAIDLFQDKWLKNNGALLQPIGLLALDENYAQGISGTLQIDIGGLSPGVGYGVFEVGGDASLDGRLILTPTNNFLPAAGDVFRVMTYGSRNGEFAHIDRELGLAFGPEYQSDAVVISDNPTLVEFSQRPDRRNVRAEQGNGFTLRAINPTTQTITATLSEVLPVAFRYLSGTLSSSLAVGEPVTSVVNDVQTLAWQQPILLAPGSTFTLHLGVALTTTPNLYTNTATLVVTPTQGSLRQIVTYDTVTIYRPATSDTQVVPSLGVAYPPAEPGDPWQLAFRKGTDLNQVSVAITTTPVCHLAACGPLSYVAIIHADQIFTMTEISPGSNRFHFVIPAGQYRNHEPTYIVLVWLTPTLKMSDQYQQCHALGITTGYGCGFLTIDRPRFFDPSGHVTDAQTGAPIRGATVTLYRVPAALPDTRISTRECRTVDTRPGGITGTWDLLPPATPGLGLFEDALFTPATIDPPLNPQTTDAAGYYGWDVIRGCWYIKVEAPGHFTKYSAVVGVPPEVTDLDIALEPWPRVYLPVVIH